MTTWTSISNAAVAVGGIPSSTTVTALRDNPSALAESASGAPVMVSGWHPHDKVYIGDGKTGLIYDHAVTGTVSNVVTPDFVDGYEYRVVAVDLLNDSASNARLSLDAFFQTGAIYQRLRYSGDGTGNSAYWGFDLEIVMPRLAKVTHLANGQTYRDGSISNDGIDNTSHETPAQKLLRARVRFTSGTSTLGNIVGGKIYLFRRREYASLP
jgi:hypothetical protein